MKHHSMRPTEETIHIIIYSQSLAKALALKTASTTKESSTFMFPNNKPNKTL